MSLFSSSLRGSSSLFGQPQQQSLPISQPPSNPSFGLSTAAPSNSILGNPLAQSQQQVSALPALSQSTTQLANSLWQPPAREPPHQKPIQDQIAQITEKWDPGNPNCAFKHYFYNKVDEANVPFYQPQPYENPREWEEALQRKPGPGFIPVLCAGFTGVSDRLKTQRRAVAELNTRIHQINASLDAILSRHDLQTTVRAAAARRRHMALQERCISLAARVQVLRNRGYALSGDEDALRMKLIELRTHVQDPALTAREEELWSRLVTLRGYANKLAQELNKPASGDGEVLDEESEQRLKKLMVDYEKQLSHLKKELESVQRDFEEWEKGTK